MFTLIKNGEVYAPNYLGKTNILFVNDKIMKLGEFDEEALQQFDVEVIDAEGMIVTPGFIDPHVHFIGGGGEGGFATRTPELQLSNIIKAGVTTLVGCLGTDGTTRHMTSLLAKARGLEEEGVTTYIYSGNYHIPTPTITANVKDDIILIDKVIGAGEIAISDARSAQPTLQDVATIVAEARIGGLLSNKCGVTHFHVGIGKNKLSYLHALIDDYELPPANIYATHISRSQGLFDDAIALAHKGAFVDITADQETGDWIKYYKEQNGDFSQLTVSSDGNGSLPKFNQQGEMIGFGVATQQTLFEQIWQTVQQHQLAIEDVLPLVTTNTARALKLQTKGQIKEQFDADVLILDKEHFELQHVFAKGQHMLRNGEAIVKGTFED